tara:strand:- start:792941 stop:793888 length:948 start_codon:yes stop_codon:yes gene_type:complete
MTAASHKSTQYWRVALKVLVLVLVFWYLFHKIEADGNSLRPILTNSLQEISLWALFTFILLATLNWLQEIAKWQQTVATFHKISFGEAAKQSLGSLTASLITPNRIGEYGAKALYFRPKHRKKILFLNFVHSSFQMLVTVLFGLPAFVYFVLEYQISMNGEVFFLIGFIIVLLAIIGYYFRKKQWFVKGLSIQNLWEQFKKITLSKKVTLFSLSALRYLTFSSLFYIFLNFFGASVTYLEVASLIFSMYLLVSVAPTFFIFDVVVRGGVAVWLFSYVAIPDMMVLATVFSMWLLNVVIPAIVGSYFVLTFKSQPS